MKNDEFINMLASQFVHACHCISIDVAYFLASQCALETGYGSSSLYKVSHNLFGMRYPKSRLTLCVGSYHNHCKFDSWFESFYDYLIWLQMCGFTQYDLRDVKSFSAKLRKKNFNPSPNYVDTILTIYNTYYHE